MPLRIAVYRALVAVFLISWAQARAGTPAGPLTLAWVLGQVARHNPDFRAAQAQTGQAQAADGQSWALPDPEVGVEYWGIPRPGLDLGQANQTFLDFSQDIPFPTKLYYQSKAAGHEVMRAQAHANAVLQDGLRAARDAFWDDYAAARSLEILGRVQAALDALTRGSRRRYELAPGDRTEQLMLPMIAMERAELDNQALELDRRRSDAEAALEGLMAPGRRLTLPPPEADPPAAAPAKDEAAFRALVRRNNPDLAEARHHVIHTQTLIQLAQTGWMPDLMLQYSLVNTVGGPATSMAVAKVNVPYLYFWKQRGAVRAAAQQAREARAMLAGAKARVLQESDAGWRDYQDGLKEWTRQDRTVLPLARRAFRLAMAGYTGGGVDALASLEAVKSYWEGESQAIALKARLGKDEALLLLLAGKGQETTFGGSHE